MMIKHSEKPFSVYTPQIIGYYILWYILKLPNYISEEAGIS